MPTNDLQWLAACPTIAANPATTRIRHATTVLWTSGARDRARLQRLERADAAHAELAVTLRVASHQRPAARRRQRGLPGRRRATSRGADVLSGRYAAGHRG